MVLPTAFASILAEYKNQTIAFVISQISLVQDQAQEWQVLQTISYYWISITMYILRLQCKNVENLKKITKLINHIIKFTNFQTMLTMEMQ